ncbi:hypothetical protein CHUV0807_2171 [Cardiobacterium hominis]|uniref:DUF6630 domain-containing protein n=2 Tax=Cardiobacterium hominis TaxID=2718 RepID=A0A1C3H6Q1_9GAMM|nr:hypothetical protein CHUV0807_2171 [Cardiobacterium hominis]
MCTSGYDARFAKIGDFMMNAVESGAAAVSRLLQLIASEPERLDEDAVLEAVQEAYDHDLPLMWAVYHLGKHEAVFAAEWADVFTLVEQLRAVAANWQADLLFGVQEAEDEALIFDCEPQTLLRAAAQELRGYGLALWRWQGDNPELCLGFICREEDTDLLQACAAALAARLRDVAEEDWSDDGFVDS